MESLNPGAAGLSYNKNHVSRSRMEQVLQQEDEREKEKTASRDAIFSRPRYEQKQRDTRVDRDEKHRHHVGQERDREHGRRGGDYRDRRSDSYSQSRWRRREQKADYKAERREDRHTQEEVRKR